MWNTPGRAAALYAVGDDEVHAFLNFALPEPPFHAFGDPAAQRNLLTTVLADAGGEVPGMLAAARDTSDLFFDAVSQIRMPRWSNGRVALAGDAAYTPSFLTGQGTSLGASMPAGSLAGRDHAEGFAACEESTRGFVTMNQDLVGRGQRHALPGHRRRAAAAQRQTAQPHHRAAQGRTTGPLGSAAPRL
ncbi:hypothetical protein [Amycolatopsis kentuckyensis]|uniref:hypothetical protein n=1 Tax=Amycolatopsis kentuckyensis TaxID=218823 RepID=UPI001ABF28C9|nr:hypothetical protein [Amycolatopsis kentuckyensis]